MTEDLHQRRDQASPSGLVASSQAGAVIAMEVFIEQDVVLPLGVVLELLCATVHWTPTGLITEEDAGQAIGNLRATSNRLIRLPEPVGHSILNLSP